MINRYEWKYLGAEHWTTSLSIGPRYKETSKKVREKQKEKKKHSKIIKK